MKKVFFGFLCMLLVAPTTYAADAPNAALFKWESVTDTGDADQARSVVISGQSVISLEARVMPMRQVSSTIRAADITTGQVQWVNQIVAYPGYANMTYLAASGDAVFALGYVQGAEPNTTDFLVRAYQISTGNLLWSDFWNAGRGDMPQGIAATNGRVTIIGYGGNQVPSEPLHGLLRTYDAVTGNVLYDFATPPGTDDAIWQLSASGNIVVTAGSTRVAGKSYLSLRAFNVQNGTPLWEQTELNAGGVPRIQGDKVMFALNELVGMDTYASLAGFDLATGTPLWQTPRSLGTFYAIAADGDRAVAVGKSATVLLMKSADPATGSVQWTVQPAPEPGFKDILKTVALTPHAVYTAGTSSQDFAYEELTVRIFDTAGNQLMDDRSHRAVNRTTTTPSAISIDGVNLSVAASATAATVDAVVRTYDVSALEPPPAPAPLAAPQLLTTSARPLRKMRR